MDDEMVDDGFACQSFDEWTWDELRASMMELSDLTDEYAGVPVPVEDMGLVIAEGYRFAEAFQVRRETEASSDVVVRNSWPLRWKGLRVGARVYVVEHEGRIRAHVQPRYRSSAAATMLVHSMRASLAYDPYAEQIAREKLADMLAPHIMAAYLTTGAFIESSERSGLTYLLRMGRPTVVLAGDRTNPDANLRVLTTLCMHPIGYYVDESGDGSMAGAMVPTDDVVSHLLFIRADEAGYWRVANQHHPESAEAAL